VGFTPE
jgi:hypothetical protein